MSPADKMNRLLLAARTPFVDAAVRIVTYGLGRGVLTNCQVGDRPFCLAPSQQSMKRSSM
jgi:hypothetical protein